MQMDGVVGHRQVAKPDAYAILAHHQRVNAGEDAAVSSSRVEVQHGMIFGRVRAGSMS
jgi:hypothetical protein